MSTVMADFKNIINNKSQKDNHNKITFFLLFLCYYNIRMITNYVINMTDIKILMIENLITGQSTNFSPMKIDKCINYLKNQERLNDEMNTLFENISPVDRFVIKDGFPKPLGDIKENQLSTIDTGLVHLATKELEFADSGSDYVSLSLIKKAYEKFDDNVVLSVKGQELLNKYKLEPSQLTAFDANELMDNIKNNQQNLSVSYLTRKTNTFMLHSLPFFKPEGNSPLKGDYTVKDKVEILRSTNPELSCSTFKSGVPHLGRDFGGSDIGVIIASGTVKMASLTDMGTVTNTAGDRVSFGSQDLSQENIEKVFNNRVNGDGYNEVIVKNPSIAGIYINLDDLSYGKKEMVLAKEFDPEHLFQIAEHLKNMANDDHKPLPIFTIFNGEIRESTLNITALRQFLPEELKDDVKKYNNDNYRVKFSQEDMNKRKEWKSLTNDEFVAIAYHRGDVLTHEDIHHKGQENELTNLRKLEILDKHQNLFKGDLGNKKINDRRLDNMEEYLNVNLSSLDNLKHKKSVDYIPSYQHKHKNKIN